VQPSPAGPPVTAPLPSNPDSILPLLTEPLQRILDDLYGLLDDILPIN
jgi:hypothetical protein